MKNTFFNDNHKQVTKDRVISYHKLEDGSYERFLQNFDALGDGNVLTTVEDLFLWNENFKNQSIGGPNFIETMLTPGILNNGDTLQYAFGLEHDTYKGVRTVSHSGGMLGFNTQFIRFPAFDFSVIVLANRSDANAYQKAHQIADIILQYSLVEEPTISAPEPEEISGVDTEENSPPNLNLEEYAGDYHSEELDVNYLFLVADGKLKLKIQDKPLLMDCSMSKNDHCSVEYRLVRFQRTEGQISGFELDFGRAKNIQFYKK